MQAGHASCMLAAILVDPEASPVEKESVGRSKGRLLMKGEMSTPVTARPSSAGCGNLSKANFLLRHDWWTLSASCTAKHIPLQLQHSKSHRQNRVADRLAQMTELCNSSPPFVGVKQKSFRTPERMATAVGSQATSSRPSPGACLHETARLAKPIPLAPSSARNLNHVPSSIRVPLVFVSQSADRFPQLHHTCLQIAIHIMIKVLRCCS